MSKFTSPKVIGTATYDQLTDAIQKISLQETPFMSSLRIVRFMTDYSVELILPISISEKELEEVQEILNEIGLKAHERGETEYTLSVFEYPNKIRQDIWEKKKDETNLSFEDWCVRMQMEEKMGLLDGDLHAHYYRW